MVEKEQSGDTFRHPSLQDDGVSSTHPPTTSSEVEDSSKPSNDSSSRRSRNSESDAVPDQAQDPSIEPLSRTLQGRTKSLSYALSPLRIADPLLDRSLSTRSRLSPSSPLSPRTRDRGYSLRTSLFKKAADARSQDGGTIEVAETSASAEGCNLPHLTFEANAKKPSPPTTVSPIIEVKKKPFASANLPNYGVWAKKVQKRSLQDHIQKGWKKVYKFVFKPQERPPCENGRQIQVNARRTAPLIDERTGKPYVTNTIRSTRYNVVDFLPRQLLFQFSKLANFYFLCISILQAIPGLSTTGSYTTVIPLIFFVMISMAKEGYDDYRRHVLDKVENNKQTSVLRAHQSGDTEREEENRISNGPQWIDIKWKDIVVGDIVRLRRNDLVPADIVLLHSDGFNGIAYIDTMALDGETNLKAKQAPPALATICNTLDGIVACDAQVTVEQPNADLYNFDGNVTTDENTLPLTIAEIVYRGSTLRNTTEAVGMVINTGEECKIRMNANTAIRIKRPTMQNTVNRVVALIVIFVLALAIYETVAYQIWSSSTEKKSWYLIDAGVPFRQILVGFIILFNTMIPLSLYVSLEIIKLGQLFLMSDVEMYDAASDTPMEARTSTINEELGQISHIFSDKTGTLTDNVMRFRKLSVCGYAFLHDFDIEKEDANRNMINAKQPKGYGKMKQIPKKTPNISSEDSGATNFNVRRSSSVASRWRSSARPAQGPQPEIRTEFLLHYLQHKPNSVFARKARFFLLSLALCHTCLPEIQENGDIDFQAASPDELALVRAAQDLGYMVIDRPAQSIVLKTFPRGPGSVEVQETYEVLDVIEFTSKRKRMSIIVRLPNSRICVFCKGADSVIASRLKLASLAIQKATEVESRAGRRKSLEAELALRRMSDHESPRNSLSRPSFSGRRKSFGVGRLSMQSTRLQPIRDGIEHWLRERETDIGRDSVDRRSAYNSPRTSVAIDRISFSIAEAHNAPEDDGLYDDMIDEAIVLNDSSVFERCFQHTNDLASEGLRTLLYAHRLLSDEEYIQWKKGYLDATTSLTNRQASIDAAGDIIEQNLELSGVTAIEDKLQSGVPETIDKLRRANIKMWMLTGDKRETAINIGHSCRLIKDYSEITILDSENGEVEQLIASTILAISQGVAHSVVVIDGQTLSDLEDSEATSMLFLDLAVVADSVICCRASPSQKASLVKKIRTRLGKSVTLAIGDGANDIAMIQEAHVGIGITGKEGMMAARTSDYSIAQFRFLQRLLLVHGRWNYIRTGKYILGTFWKEMLFFLHQALYQEWTGYTGTSLFESVSLALFNTLFTSLCVILLGIFEQDLAAETLLAVPELYTVGQKNGSFSIKKYVAWMFMAVCDVMILYFLAFKLWGLSPFTVDDTVFPMGNLAFGAAIIVINSKLLFLEMHNKTYIPVIGWIVTVGGWFIFNLLLSVTYSTKNSIYYVNGAITDRFGRSLQWWTVLLISISATLLFELSVASLRKSFFPSDANIFQELEKDVVIRQRFKDAANGKESRGLDHGGEKNKSSLEVKREREVQELLDRPRVMAGDSSDSIGSELHHRRILDVLPSPTPGELGFFATSTIREDT